jgi:hypothetical protein
METQEKTMIVNDELCILNKEIDSEMSRITKYGQVPTFYESRRRWLKKSKYESPSILQKLEQAVTVEEVKSILEIGAAYKSASSGTIIKWQKLADKRIRELNV